MKKIVSIAAALAMFVSSSAMAATLSDMNGKVLVNTGEGYVAATDALELPVGSSVMVGEESFATIAYGDCAVVLSKPAVHTVTADGCLTKTSDQGVFIAPTADVVGGDAYVAEAAPFIPLPFLFLAAGGATVGILVASGALKNKNKGVSGS